MTDDYRAALSAVTPILVEIVERHVSDELNSAPHLFDAVVQDAMRVLGRSVAEAVVSRLSDAAVKAAKAQGFRIERSPECTLTTVFGEITVRSPYLSGEKGSGGTRPVNELLRVRSGGRSVRLERAMCDFGVDESFEASAQKLNEHYGITLNRTTFLRTVQKHGAEIAATSSVERTKARCQRPVEGPGVPYLVEMDGSSVRTGTLVKVEGGGLTQKRQLERRKRCTEWRDLRLALVRRLSEDEPTFVGCIADFGTVIDDLIAEAIAMGWTPATLTVRLTDGGPGLREALDERFLCGLHILDKFHLIHQLHATATEMFESDKEVKASVAEWIEQVSTGDVAGVRRRMLAHEGRGAARATQLAGYLKRFADAVHYDEFERFGYPIGSGEIESAHKSEVQRRLKLPGTWWTVRGANQLLALRLARTNSRWESYWNAA